MPYTSGIFANVSGASNAAAGQVVQSAVWNNIHTDYSTALTQVMQQLIASITNRNILWMNGGFEIWQRGAGASSSIAIAAGATSYTADRWYLTTGANQACAVSAQTGLMNASALCGRVQRNAAQTGTGVLTFGYPLDSDELARLRGTKATLSFAVQAGANFSPVNGTLTAALYVGTGAVAKRGAGFTSETTVLSVSTNITTSVVSVSATSSAVVPTTATQGEIQFTWTPAGTAGAADYFNVDDVQIESNLTSSTTWTISSFDRIAFSTMLSGCKRHYESTFPYGVAPAAGAGMSNAPALIVQNTGARQGYFWKYDEKRTAPTFSKYHPTTATSSNWLTLATIAGVSASAVASIDTVNQTNGTKGIFVYSATAAAGQDSIFMIHLGADAGI